MTKTTKLILFSGRLKAIMMTITNGVIHLLAMQVFFSFFFFSQFFFSFLFAAVLFLSIT